MTNSKIVLIYENMGIYNTNYICKILWMNSDCLFVSGSEIPVGRHHRILFGCGNIYSNFEIFYQLLPCPNFCKMSKCQ
jgi:hypothetical protein